MAEVETVTRVRGVEVKQASASESSELPGVVYQVYNRRDNPVQVRLVQQIPAETDATEFDFSRVGDPNEWTVTDESMVFESEVDVDGELKTGFTIPSRELYQSFEDGPRVESIEPIDTDPVVDRIEESGDTSDLISRESPNVGDAADEDLIDELVARVEADELSESVEARLHERFDTGDEGGSDSVEVRLDHLQQRLSDLEAYTAALEDVYEERGTLQEAFAETEAQIEGVESTVEQTAEQVDDMDSRVTDVQESVAANDEEIGALKSDVESLSEWQDEINEMFMQFGSEGNES